MCIQRQNRGVTLLELLTSLVIVSIIAALILPSIASSREAARSVQCKNNLRQLGLAALEFELSQKHLPPGMKQDFFPSAPIYRGSSVFVHILPYVERIALRGRWDFDDPLRNTEGGYQSFTAQVIPNFVCPSDRILINPIQQQGWHYAITSYGGNGGTRSYMPAQSSVDGLFHTTGSASEPQPHQEAVRLSAIQDGMSHTLMFGERSHVDRYLDDFAAKNMTQPISQVGWWAPSGGRRAIGHVTMSAMVPINFRITYSPEHTATLSGTPNAVSFPSDVEKRWCAWGSSHAFGTNFCYADGSTHFVDENIDHQVLERMSTRSGGD